MRILFFIVLVILFILCVRKIRKMIKANQAMDADEERQSIRGNRVFGVLASGAVIAGLFLWFFLSMEPADKHRSHHLHFKKA